MLIINESREPSTMNMATGPISTHLVTSGAEQAKRHELNYIRDFWWILVFLCTSGARVLAPDRAHAPSPHACWRRLGKSFGSFVAPGASRTKTVAYIYNLFSMLGTVVVSEMGGAAIESHVVLLQRTQRAQKSREAARFW